jgi:uncharacterized protein (TIGR02001 family)
MAALLLPFSVQAAAQEAQEEEAGFSGSAELVSDYRFRGVSLSNRKPALQAGVEYAHSSGFFGGTWGSNIAEVDTANVELDLYAGYAGTAAGMTYTVTALKYLYPGASGLSYIELQSRVEAPLGPLNVAFEFAYTPDQENVVDNLYTAAGVSYGGPHALNLSAKLGRENGAYDRKWDWEVGISREFGPLSLRATFVGTNHRAARLGDQGSPTIMVGAGLNI